MLTEQAAQNRRVFRQGVSVARAYASFQCTSFTCAFVRVWLSVIPGRSGFVRRMYIAHICRCHVQGLAMPNWSIGLVLVAVLRNGYMWSIGLVLVAVLRN